jgi:hypothetical protein
MATKPKANKAPKKTHVMIATPMYGGMCAGFYTQSVIQLQKLFHDHDIDVSFTFMFNESLITRARNGLVNTFLKMEEATHLMFIDADIRFFPDHILPMIEANKDIICGIYPKKEINWGFVRNAIQGGVPDEQLQYHTGSFVVNLVKYSGNVTVPVNEPVEIWNGGTGFMLIKRKVFEKLAKVVPSYTNNIVDLSKNLKVEPIKEFFTTSIEPETNVLMSEDYHFCRLARLNKMKVWAAPWAQLGHFGNYMFEGQLTPAP